MLGTISSQGNCYKTEWQFHWQLHADAKTYFGFKTPLDICVTCIVMIQASKQAFSIVFTTLSTRPLALLMALRPQAGTEPEGEPYRRVPTVQVGEAASRILAAILAG